MKQWIKPALFVGASAVLLGLVAAVQSPGAVNAQPSGAVDDGGSLEPAVAPLADNERRGSTRQRIGWDHAEARLGRAMPTGRQIAVAQVEAGENYIPNDLRGVTFILESGETRNSGHATNVSVYAFGRESPAPGVSRVHVYSTNGWMRDDFLKVGTTEDPDTWGESRVFNHSWIAMDVGFAPQLLRRVDWVIDEKDIIMCVGVNNAQGAIPHLLASAHNVISVGVPSGNHSRGTTRIEGEGRCKPEIVAPGQLTSWSTPVVTACVAQLLQAGDALVARDEDGPNADAVHSEVIKAVLLGGAYKPEGWSPAEDSTLDRRWGAGIVDIDRSLLMMQGGVILPGTVDAPEQTRKRYAWAFDEIEPNSKEVFAFTADEDQGEVCFTLAFNRRVLGGAIEVRNRETGETREFWNNTAMTANLDLELVRLNADGTETVVAISESDIDNVEMIFLRELEAGDYQIRVTRSGDGLNDPWDYALGWRIESE